MIRIFPSEAARPHVVAMIQIHVGDKEFKNEADAINFLEKLKFFGSEILECDFVSVPE